MVKIEDTHQEEVFQNGEVSQEAMETMLNMEGDMLAITLEEPSDPSTFIMFAVGQHNNWTWVECSKNMGKKFCSASSNVFFSTFSKMNYDLAYFNVFYNIEILHLNDFNEFENEINKQLEKKFETMEPTLGTLNLGNDENPCLIKSGSTLNEKERKDLQELLT